MAARRLHTLIYVTIANCCLLIIVCSVALGTNQWFSVTVSTGTGSTLRNISASYGLFVGKKWTQVAQNSPSHRSLKLVCKGSNCMFSCGDTPEKRKLDLENLLLGNEGDDATYCEPGVEVAALARNKSSPLQQGGGTTNENSGYLNFGLYLTTIAFIGLGIIFAIVSGMLALYNTYRTPIQPVLSILGLYVWNGLASAFVFLGMIMWVVEFTSRLQKNAAVSETISQQYDTADSGFPGFSFWILILAVLFPIANVVILRYRSWKIVKMEEKNVRVMTDKLESGDILLF